jgi:hypothetical protein
VNGHEWARRQAQVEGLGFTELANGFASCAEPTRLQAICNRLGPTDLQAFFDRWVAVIPTPLNAVDQEAGDWCELSMRQVETSRTLVFDAPRRARAFFEALVADNLDLGRPDEVQLTAPREGPSLGDHLRAFVAAVTRDRRVLGVAGCCETGSSCPTRVQSGCQTAHSGRVYGGR